MAALTLIPPIAAVPGQSRGQRYGASRDGGARTHAGVDYPAPVGRPVVAAADGQVTRAGTASGYGTLVVVRHSLGWETRYGHLSELTCGVGDEVVAGEVVGLCGNTGTSSGPHLHFEARALGVAVDPLMVIADPYLCLSP